MMNWYNILERSLWTAVETAIAAVPVAQVAAAVAGGNIDALEQLALSALGAGAGALLAFIKTVAKERLAVLRNG